MLVQNVSRRNFVLKIDGEIKTVGPSSMIEADEELAKDLIENYNGEWVEVKLPEPTKNGSGQKTEKMIETKVDKKKK